MSEQYSMTRKLLTLKEAADRCGIPAEYLIMQIRQNHGPKYVQPSLKSKFFREEDLDQWVAGWKQSSGT